MCAIIKSKLTKVILLNLYNKRKRVNIMEELKYSQIEILQLINQYNNTDRKVIKSNLKRILTTHNIKPKQIISLGYSSANTYAWLSPATNNIPLINQSLEMAVAFNFDVQEFIV